MELVIIFPQPTPNTDHCSVTHSLLLDTGFSWACPSVTYQLSANANDTVTLLPLNLLKLKCKTNDFVSKSQ